MVVPRGWGIRTIFVNGYKISVRNEERIRVNQNMIKMNLMSLFRKY